jgi:hypothetical protein
MRVTDSRSQPLAFRACPAGGVAEADTEGNARAMKARLRYDFMIGDAEIIEGLKHDADLLVEIGEDIRKILRISFVGGVGSAIRFFLTAVLHLWEGVSVAVWKKRSETLLRRTAARRHSHDAAASFSGSRFSFGLLLRHRLQRSREGYQGHSSHPLAFRWTGALIANLPISNILSKISGRTRVHRPSCRNR